MKKKKHSEKSDLILHENIARKIILIRDKKVMLDRDISELYGVETRILNQAVKRNIERFPDDFMFQLTKEEMANWISQTVISNNKKMGIRKRPNAFTQEGVAMLSSVLSSKRAIQVNLQIMRVFVKLREMLSTHADLRKKVKQLEKKYQSHDKQFQIVFEAIKQLLAKPQRPAKKIGFHVD